MQPCSCKWQGACCGALPHSPGVVPCTRTHAHQEAARRALRDADSWQAEASQPPPRPGTHAGVYINISPLDVGWAKLVEITRYIRAFRESGKFCWAYMELGGEKVGTPCRRVLCCSSVNGALLHSSSAT